MEQDADPQRQAYQQVPAATPAGTPAGTLAGAPAAEGAAAAGRENCGHAVCHAPK